MCTGSVYYADMKKAAYRRLNITLPQETVEILASVVDKGSRSNFIDIAIRNHVIETRKVRLREGLKAGAIANAERDLEIAREWSEIEDDLWAE
jgi:metal-responsive CopG/Arc/MetJ family transcriptional regulator